MSGIYIPNIEMPDEEQSVITVNTYSDGVSYCYDDNAERTVIPVHDHGRLVDAEEITLPKGFFETVTDVSKFYEWLAKQPTIIPADKEATE